MKLAWQYFDADYRNFNIIPFDQVTSDDYWFVGGDFAEYERGLKNRLQTSITDLKFD